MFERDTLYRLWMKLRPLKTWYFLVAAVVSMSVSIVALRNNNLEMVRLRNATYAADQQNHDVNGALKALQAYVTAHMNTNLTAGNGSVYPPIQLKYTYQRLQAAAQAAADAQKTQIYTDAQHYCEQQNSTDFSGRNRVPCIENYVTNHAVAAQTVPTAMYEFDFVSPSWSPDLAGWSLVTTVALLLLAVVRFGLGRWLQRATR